MQTNDRRATTTKNIKSQPHMHEATQKDARSLPHGRAHASRSTGQRRPARPLPAPHAIKIAKPTQRNMTLVQKIWIKNLNPQGVCTPPHTKLIPRGTYTVHHVSFSSKWLILGAKTLPAIEAWVSILVHTYRPVHYLWTTSINSSLVMNTEKVLCSLKYVFYRFKSI